MTNKEFLNAYPLEVWIPSAFRQDVETMLTELQQNFAFTWEAEDNKPGSLGGFVITATALTTGFAITYYRIGMDIQRIINYKND